MNSSVEAESSLKEPIPRPRSPAMSDGSGVGALALAKKKRAPTSRKKKVWFWIPECKYSVIINRAKELNWRLLEGERLEAKANLYWIDVAAIHDRFRTIQPWQMINHFPGMPNIARKNRMGHHLNKMAKMFPQQYNFFPRTWVLPGEMADFRAQFDAQGNALGNKIFIIKPDTGCQGRGIFLTRTFGTVPKLENVVAQVYIKNPLLLDGFKFDLRLYCVVTSVKPFRVYLFQDGLVRICTEEYVKPTKSNLDNSCMHLTNYAVNKHNANFQQPAFTSKEEHQDEGNKRSLTWFLGRVREEKGVGKANWLWDRMGTLCVRTVMSILPILSREYDQHFKEFSNIPVKFAEKAPNTSRYISDIFAAANKKRDGSDDEEEEGSDEENEEQKDDKKNPTPTCSKKDAEKEATPQNPPIEEGPRIRGSRCFEVLGFDVMITETYKPILIEVNHLPSFGTDSPLDLDIKSRLFSQLLRAIPVMQDDEQAFLHRQREESEQRLMKKREKEKQDVIEKTFGKSNAPKKTAPTPYIHKAKPAEDVAKKPEMDAQQRLELEQKKQQENLDRIRGKLIEIYIVHRPEKVSKVDKLLARYDGYEEQFLLYVHQKYNIEYFPPDPEPSSEPEPAIPLMPQPPVRARDANRSSLPAKRSTRSLSPSLSGSQKSKAKMAAVQKSRDDSDKDQMDEVLKLYIPAPDDEWMLQESKFLTQFTRIFPPEGSETRPAKEEEDDVGSEVGDGSEVSAVPAASSGLSYADIMLQIFKEDRRTTSRLTNPLNAAKARPISSEGSGDGGSLPPLPNKSQGVKAPPADTAKQVENMQRLYKGLSVDKRIVSALAASVAASVETKELGDFADTSKLEAQAERRSRGDRRVFDSKPALAQKLFSFPPGL